MNEEISFGKVIAEDLLGVGNLENTTEITQVNKAKTIRAESKTLFFMNGRFDCPHCSKGIYFEVEKELSDDEVTPKETSCGEIKMDKRDAPTKLILLKVLNDKLQSYSLALCDSVKEHNYEFYAKHSDAIKNIFRIYNILEAGMVDAAVALQEIKNNKDHIMDDIVMKYYVELDKAIKGEK
jgi:hypothetical protein